jgi:hypothetical protein
LGRKRCVPKVVSYFELDGKLYNAEDLTKESRRAAADMLILQLCRCVYGTAGSFGLKNAPDFRKLVQNKKG